MGSKLWSRVTLLKVMLRSDWATWTALYMACQMFGEASCFLLPKMNEKKIWFKKTTKNFILKPQRVIFWAQFKYLKCLQRKIQKYNFSKALWTKIEDYVRKLLGKHRKMSILMKMYIKCKKIRAPFLFMFLIKDFVAIFLFSFCSQMADFLNRITE